MTSLIPSNSSISADPSPLLALPPEIWHLIMTFTRHPRHIEPEYPLYEVLLYRGERDRQRCNSLSNISLAYRQLQPFAQEALLNSLHIRSDRTVIILLRACEVSSALRGSAQRSESIALRYDGSTAVNPALLMQLAEACPNVTSLALDNTPVELAALTLFSKLKVLSIAQASITFGQKLRPLLHLESIALSHNLFISVGRDHRASYDLLRPFFNSLPALRRIAMLDIDTSDDFTEPPWIDILPQITHLHFIAAPFTSYAHQMNLAPQLKSLNVSVEDSRRGLPAFIESLSKLDLEAFYFSENSSGTFSEVLDGVKKMYDTVIKHKNLKLLSLLMVQTEQCIQPVGSPLHQRWLEFKAEIRATCAKRGIQIVASDWQIFAKSNGRNWERSDITWID